MVDTQVSRDTGFRLVFFTWGYIGSMDFGLGFEVDGEILTLEVVVC